MKLIHKFTFDGKPHKYLHLPDGAKVVHVHEQNGDVAVWYSFDDDVALNVGRDFYIVGTGHQYANDMVYLGSAHVDAYVWHVMEQAPPTETP